MANEGVDGDTIGVEVALSIFLLFLMAKGNPTYSKGLMLFALISGIVGLVHLGVMTGKIATTKTQKTESLYLHFLLAYCALIAWCWLS